MLYIVVLQSKQHILDSVSFFCIGNSSSWEQKSDTALICHQVHRDNLPTSSTWIFLAKIHLATIEKGYKRMFMDFLRLMTPEGHAQK